MSKAYSRVSLAGDIHTASGFYELDLTQSGIHAFSGANTLSQTRKWTRELAKQRVFKPVPGVTNFSVFVDIASRAPNVDVSLTWTNTGDTGHYFTNLYSLTDGVTLSIITGIIGTGYTYSGIGGIGITEFHAYHVSASGTSGTSSISVSADP